MLNVSKTKIMLIGTHQRLNAVDSFLVTEDNTSLEGVDTFKHLGVIMDETLSWKEHVSSMGKKISSRLALLRRARKVLPKSACDTLYNTMVLPLFHYCAVVWDNCGQGSKSYLDKLNRRAACIIEGRAVKSDALSTGFGWPHLQACRNFLKSVLVYKGVNDITPSYLLSEVRYAHQIHSHFTKQRDQLRLPLANTTKYQGSFRINGARAYNSLPSNIRSVTDFNTFKSLAKRHFKRQCVQSL